MNTVLPPELMEKLERLKRLEIEAQELRAELQPWLDNACRQYFVAWFQEMKPIFIKFWKTTLITKIIFSTPILR